MRVCYLGCCGGCEGHHGDPGEASRGDHPHLLVVGPEVCRQAKRGLRMARRPLISFGRIQNVLHGLWQHQMALAVSGRMLVAHAPAHLMPTTCLTQQHTALTVAPCAAAVGFINHDASQQPPPVQRPAAGAAAAAAVHTERPRRDRRVGKDGTSGIECHSMHCALCPRMQVWSSVKTHPSASFSLCPLTSCSGVTYSSLMVGRCLPSSRNTACKQAGRQAGSPRQWQRQRCVRPRRAAPGRSICCQSCKHRQGFPAAAPSPTTGTCTRPPTRSPTHPGLCDCLL